MSGHLCLKWNNHSTAFIKSISNIQIKERYCDATIACQGRYFPVHRVVLSTCSDYFDEIFERIDCPHPYIIFKDIEPREMELLLNYMYQGEVNVVQENLPTLIKAAEALKVKGLAVPDDLPASKESSKKRSSDTQLPKRRSEEKRRRRDSSDQNSHLNNSSTTSDRNSSKSDVNLEGVENKVIKEEPLESAEYENPPMQSNYGEAGFSGGSDTNAAEPSQVDPGEKSDSGSGIFVGFPGSEETENFIKSEDPGPTEPYNEEQSSSWSDFTGGDIMQDLPETSTQDDMYPRGGNFGALLLDASRLPKDTPLKQSPSPTMEINSFVDEVSNSRVHVCPHCNYKSRVINNVRQHIRFKHTGEKPFNCLVCFKTFATKQNLQVHMRIHTGEKPFKCNVCFREFTQSGSYKSHACQRSSVQM